MDRADLAADERPAAQRELLDQVGDLQQRRAAQPGRGVGGAELGAPSCDHVVDDAVGEDLAVVAAADRLGEVAGGPVLAQRRR